ncbi:hypothetical protein TWF730_005831 [Orbilia blumenaviensis]|uniref:Uncharacterized protein n=1 Tax=Orbilia blumenaviensis TaxID=1796055 RepID=A0AAV9VJR9_9PEZI
MRSIIAALFSLFLVQTLAAPLDEETPPDDFSDSPTLDPRPPAVIHTRSISKRVIGGRDTDPELLALFNKTDNISKRAVGSNIFFNWSVVCAPPGDVVRMPSDPNLYPIIASLRRPDLSSPHMREPVQRVRDVHNGCRHCLCTSEGEMVRNPLPHPTGREAVACKAWYRIQRCQVWYACRCQLEMRQPRIEPGNSIRDYQNALNQIPTWVKLSAPYYEWNLAPRFTMSWQYLSKEERTGNADAGPLGLPEPNNRMLVPGEKEPYYLEGPSQGTAREWMKGSLLREGALGRGFGPISQLQA